LGRFKNKAIVIKWKIFNWPKIVYKIFVTNIADRP